MQPILGAIIGHERKVLVNTAKEKVGGLIVVPIVLIRMSTHRPLKDLRSQPSGACYPCCGSMLNQRRLRS